MITSHSVHPAAAVAWNPQGEPRRQRTADVPSVAGVWQVRFTAGNETTNVSWSVTDIETGQVYIVTSTGSATEATMLDNALAALQASEIGRKLFTITEDGVDDVVFTARHKNRDYDIVATGGPSATAPATSELTAPSGPPRLSYGFMARGSGARECAAIGASTALADLIGVLHRNEARALRQLPDVDDAVQAVTISLNREYDSLPIPYESGSAPSAGGSVFLRRALTSGAGTVGWIRGSAAGTGATYTATPAAANLLAYGFEFGFRGRHYSAAVEGDGSTTVAQAVTALVAQLGSISGLTITDSTTTVTIACDGAEDLDYIRETHRSGDSGAATVTIANTVAADIDTIDVSSIVEVVEVLSGLGLALCHVNL
jgi:hypothetical protein